MGVILISILTGRFPFFNSADDAEAVLEIGVLYGQREMKKVAASFSKFLALCQDSLRISAGLMADRCFSCIAQLFI